MPEPLPNPYQYGHIYTFRPSDQADPVVMERQASFLRPTQDPVGTTSPTNSLWNHFGRMGLVGSESPTGDTMRSYPSAFSLVLSYDATLAMEERSRRLHFPVNPETIAFPVARAIGSADVLSAAQITQVGNKQLRQVSFESFFPAAYDEEYCLPVPGGTAKLDRSPRESADWIEQSMSSTDSLYLHLYTGSSPQAVGAQLPPPLRCYVSAFQPQYLAGHPLDLFFSIELMEYRPASVNSHTATSRLPWTPKQKWIDNGYKVGKHDTLAKIAKIIYGPSYAGAWRQLKADYNQRHPKKPLKTTKNVRVTKASDQLKSGQVLVVRPYRGGATA